MKITAISPYISSSKSSEMVFCSESYMTASEVCDFQRCESGTIALLWSVVSEIIHVVIVTGMKILM